MVSTNWGDCIISIELYKAIIMVKFRYYIMEHECDNITDEILVTIGVIVPASFQLKIAQLKTMSMW